MRLIRSAWVIARRDFTAIITSKAFIFFLLGPLFPVAVGVVSGLLGAQVAREADQPRMAVVMSASDTAAIIGARDALVTNAGASFMPVMVSVPDVRPDDTAGIESLLRKGKAGGTFSSVLSGSLDAPVLTGTASATHSLKGDVALAVGQARAGGAAIADNVATRNVARSGGSQRMAQITTAQAAQVLLFLLTMLLAGMVLSNLVEEKSNKIIEILAAAIPIDAVFLGKLFAMLAMAFCGLVVWFTVGTVAVQAFGAAMPASFSGLPAPAVGWPLFLTLGIVYFAMTYLLIGSLFLGIGSMAATVREVQTLNMPTTMGQLIVFFFASYTVTKIGQPVEIAAAIFPFSSPFAMLARAAQESALWPHLLAIRWQALWVALVIRISVYLFRRNVMKSGRRKKSSRKAARA
jgi:ABC-2 type transport system permease protein